MVFVIHWHELAKDLHVFPIPIPAPTSLSTRSLWVFPGHQARALFSCIQPGLVISFTLDNIYVLMLFSRNIPPLPSPTESKSLFCTSSILGWAIPWTEEPGGLQSMGSQKSQTQRGNYACMCAKKSQENLKNTLTWMKMKTKSNKSYGMPLK